MLVARLLALAFAVMVASCAVQTQAGIVVTVEGSVPAPIAALQETTTSLASGTMQSATFDPPDGQTEIALPTTFGLLLEAERASAREGAFDGDFEICVTAVDAASTELGSGCATTTLIPGDVVNVTVTLAFDAVCGDGTQEDTEECDGMDLAGEDCVSQGFPGGMLACTGMCTFDVTGCGDAPTVPVLRTPMNGTRLGSVHVPGSLRPSFVWVPSTVAGGGSVSYELEYSPDETFASPETVVVQPAVNNHNPGADLPVSMTPPVGARYYWHVRACANSVCSDFSPTWYFDLGRDERDYDGDGYADLAIGASGASSVFVYLGGSGAFDTTYDVLLMGQAADDAFGISVAAAGDLNADGFADLVVGASASDAGPVDAGAAFVFFGGVTFDVTPDGVLTGALTLDGFGDDVASAGDVNGDGFADLIVGAPMSDLNGPDSGSVSIFLGGPGSSFDPAPDGVLAGTAGAGLGTAVSSAGDVNGDGYADVIVGTWNDEAEVYFGGAGASFDPVPETVLSGPAGDAFGFAVACAGDVNADGFSDVVVGEPMGGLVGGMMEGKGRALVFMGGAGTELDSTPDGAAMGTLNGDSLGTSVALAGDVNGDGYSDIVVGSGLPFFGSAPGVNKVWVYFGGPGSTFNMSVDGYLLGSAEYFGLSVSTAGDVNGDGFKDIIVGAPANDAAGFNSGAAYLFLGGSGATFEATSDATLMDGTTDDDWFGFALASARRRVNLGYRMLESTSFKGWDHGRVPVTATTWFEHPLPKQPKPRAPAFGHSPRGLFVSQNSAPKVPVHVFGPVKVPDSV